MFPILPEGLGCKLLTMPDSKCFIISSNHRVGNCRVRLEFLVTPEQFAYFIQVYSDETQFRFFNFYQNMVNLMTRPLSVPIKPYTKNSDQSSHLPIQLYIQTILTQKNIMQSKINSHNASNFPQFNMQK